MNSDYDIPFDEYGFDDTPYVTKEEMIDLLKERAKNADKKIWQLEFDKNSGLYFTDYFACDGGMLQEHLLAEQIVEHLEKGDKFDWLRITNGYDFNIVSQIQNLIENPLVWVDELPYELTQKYVVTGKVAEEKSSEERSTFSTYDFISTDINDARIEWFAKNLPTKNNLPNREYYYSNVPDDMILWNLLLTDRHDLFSYNLYDHRLVDPLLGNRLWPFCNPENFRREIGRIYTRFGAQKAAQIVRLLRDDWQDIKAMKLFGVDKLIPEQIAEFEQCLFAGMDRNLRKWDAETPKVEDPKPAKKKPAQQDRTYITFTMSGITVGHIDLLRQKLIQVGWIAKDTLPDDFYKLFSGKTNSDKITWTGAVGKGMLLFLFQKMVDQGEIVVPDNHSIATILESHFVNEHGKYISGLNSSKESPKHFPIVKECLNILQLEVDND